MGTGPSGRWPPLPTYGKAATLHAMSLHARDLLPPQEAFVDVEKYDCHMLCVLYVSCALLPVTMARLRH